jgi:phosphoglycerate dehydrogenase-like enzyme
VTTTATAAPAATATKTAIVLAPVNDLTRKRTEEYNAIATELGGHVKFALVNSDKSFEDIVRASAGGIAITTPVYRAIREGLINDLVQKVPTIKLVQAASAGTDRFDKKRLAELGCAVANHGGANAVAVAEHAIALMFGISRKFHKQMADVRAGLWNSEITALPIPEFRTLVGKQVGIIGLGNVGSRIAKRLQGWECNVVFHDVRTFDDAYVAAAGAKPMPLDQLLATSDIVSVNVPLERTTRYLISDRELALMKPTAILINTARGPVVEEAALVRALRNRQILGAGLDVTEKEPIDLENPLFGFDNVILTPHMATRALESDLNTLRFVLANIDRLARGEALQSVVLPV